MVPVLIAEYDEGIRSSLRMVLEDAGYHPIMETATGTATVTLLRQATEPMIVVLDLLLSQNGQLVIDALVHDPALTACHEVILITASRPANFPPAVMRVSWPIIFMPFDLDQLVECINQAAASLERQRE